MDPRQLRELVETEINALIDRPLWDQEEALQAREKHAVELQLRNWSLFQGLGAGHAWGLL
jgi:hypothetical protein